MSLNQNAILTLAEARSYLNPPSNQTGKDDIIEGFINAASSFIETMIGNPVVPADFEEVLNGSGGVKLYASHSPIITLVGATIPDKLDNLQARTAFDADWQNLFDDAGKFTIVKNRSHKNFREHFRRLDGGIFPYGRQNIRILVTCGWTTIPEDFMQCCREMVESLWLDSPHGANQLTKSEITDSQQGQSHTTKLKKMSDRWKEILGPYMREE